MNIQDAIKSGKEFTNNNIGKWLKIQDGYIYANQQFTPSIDDLLNDNWILRGE